MNGSAASKIFRSGMVRFALVWVAAFWLLEIAVSHGMLIEIVNSVLIAVSAAVMVAYFPAVYSAMTTRMPSEQQYLLVGIWLAWLHSFLLRVWTLAFRASGKPDWMLDDPTWALFLYIGVLGGTLHVTAPGAVDGVVPKRNWLIWGICVGTAIAATLIGSWWLSVHIEPDLIP